MAVRTHNLALGDLGNDYLPRISVRQLSDIASLVTHVIELQHDGIGLAAVGAGMIEEMAEDANLVRAPDPLVTPVDLGVVPLLIASVIGAVALAA